MTTLSIGDNAPTFEAISTAGSIKLTDTKGHKLVVFFTQKTTPQVAPLKPKGFGTATNYFARLVAMLLAFPVTASSLTTASVKNWALTFR
jgi:Peroxiredoxin